MLGRLNSLTKLFCMDFGQSVAAARGMPRFLREYRAFREHGDQSFPMGKLYPCLIDRSENSGTASGAYFHQDLLVASRIFEAAPQRHVDVGSRIDGFVAHVACFREIEVFDIRPLASGVKNIVFRQVDMMKPLAPELTAYTDSLSCLHALEHFGLGRYGDLLDPAGYVQGFRNLTELLKSGGRLYFSIPIGPQRIEFNAHRVFQSPIC